MAVICGIDQIDKILSQSDYKKKKLGLLCHPSSVTRTGLHLAEVCEKQGEVVAFFGPQHGIFGETQDNMIEWQDFKDSKGRPVYSLYGKNRKPTPQSLEGIDLVIVDLFDVGTRVYTFIYTMFYMIEACAEAGVEILILDRPNPLGGNDIEGNLLDLDYQSFVGLHPIPMAHGMTVGELATYFATRIDREVKLQVLKLKKWKRSERFPHFGHPWRLPSPNMPNFEACRLYPGLVLLEGTSISEGRGTTRPFELIGAPFFNWAEIEKHYRKICHKLDLVPVHFHRQGFIPNFHKHAGEVCHGALQILPDQKGFQPLRHMAVLLWVFRKLYQDAWSWAKPPYEYEYEKLPIDVIMGGPQLRECIDHSQSLKKLFHKWQADENMFKQQRKNFLFYR